MRKHLRATRMPDLTLIIGRIVAPEKPRSLWLRYGLALLLPCLGFVITWQVFDLKRAPYFSFFMTSVVLTSIFGGLRPGLVDTAISTILAFLVAPPAWTIYLSEPEDRLRIGLFAVLGCFISLVVDAVGQLHRRQLVINQALARAEKLAAVGKFAATLAHQVNNPLEATINLLYLAETAEDLSTARSHAQAALQETMRAAHFVHKTLSFAKSDDRQHDVELAPLIDNVIELYRNSIYAKNIRVLMRCPRGIWAHGNPSEMLQVISNLLSNALDAIQDGGTLYLRLARSKNGSVRLVIGDTGCGIARENFPKLFDAFFTTKAKVGVGLGLWVTKQIVDAHQGRIQVRSRVGRGTVVRVSLNSARKEQGLDNGALIR